MATTRTLVIGGNGAIGNFVTRRLVALGERPVVLSPSGNSEFIADILDRVELVRGTVLDAAGLATVMDDHGVTRVAHMGALLNAASEADPAEAARVGVVGTANVLDAARNNGIKRVIFTSTKAVYGPPKGEHSHPTYKPLSEDACPNPTNVYATMKLCSEHLGRRYRHKHGIEFAAVRFGSSMGPGKLRRHSGANAHARMIENAMLGLPTRVATGGEAVTDTVYNDDGARGVVAALEAPSLRSDVFNIATGKGTTLPDFAAAVRDVIPNADIEIGPGTHYIRPDAGGHCVMDISRARDELGYEPNLDLASWVRHYIETMERLRFAPTPT